MELLVKKILFPLLTIITALLLILQTVKSYKKNSKKDIYVIKSYKNTIALYKNNEIVQVYNSIVLNTLPQNDILNFNSGISVSTEAQAEAILEDFDG